MGSLCPLARCEAGAASRQPAGRQRYSMTALLEEAGHTFFQDHDAVFYPESAGFLVEEL